jgi:ribosomal-protein-alanine N-acetyltransferase
VAIERVSFSDPWSEAGFVEALETPAGFGLVAERDGELLGYVVGRVVAGEGEILNLAVAPGVRRTGVGRALLEAALDLLVRRGGREVFLEVRVSNLAARRLYEAAGFRVVGVRPRYYRRPVEDALVLRRALAPPA